MKILEDGNTGEDGFPIFLDNIVHDSSDDGFILVRMDGN
jgi:hypothetical protein